MGRRPSPNDKGLKKTEENSSLLRNPCPAALCWNRTLRQPDSSDYFYCVDEDFGPFFLKFCSYFPYNAKLCINGHEYLKRQLAKRGVAFEALDNGIRSCADPV